MCTDGATRQDKESEIYVFDTCVCIYRTVVGVDFSVTWPPGYACDVL
jgi:hypothetical protein